MSTRKITQDAFISRCIELHGSKFDYSKTIYKNAATKIEVKCTICGNNWFVSPGNHIGPRKSGCPECKKVNSIKRNKSIFNTTWFVGKSKKIHGTKFDYSNTNYVDIDTKVLINCPAHGNFEQWPSDHMNGIGCSKCSGTHKKSTDQFVDEARNIFPEYDYSLVNYNGAHALVDIICCTHGKFQIKPNTLLNNSGCPKCSITRQLATKIQKGIIRDPSNIPEYEKYRIEVWKISNQQFIEHYYKINPNNIRRNTANHLDHKYSIQQGWQNKVPANIIGSWKNLQIISGKENRQKGNKCSVTLEDII